MTAVAVWDHRPTSDELLQARFERGWVPTPTATQEGVTILGYAACSLPPVVGSGNFPTASEETLTGNNPDPQDESF